MSFDEMLAAARGRWKIAAINLTLEADNKTAVADRMDSIAVGTAAEHAPRPSPYSKEYLDSLPESERLKILNQEARERNLSNALAGRVRPSGPSIELSRPIRAAAEEARAEAAWCLERIAVAEQTGGFLVDPMKMAEMSEEPLRAAASRAGRLIIRPINRPEPTNRLLAAYGQAAE